MSKTLAIIFQTLLFFHTITLAAEETGVVITPANGTTQRPAHSIKSTEKSKLLITECDDLAKRAILTECPTYTALKEIASQNGFDPYQHALHLAGLRLRYLKTAQKYLTSQWITLEEKVKYCLGANSYLEETLNIAIEKKSNSFSLRPIMYLLNVTEAEIKDMLNIGGVEEVQPEHIIVASFLKRFDTAILQWRYFHQSLLNLQLSESRIAGAKQLLKEALIASNYADIDHSNTLSRYTFDHIFFVRSLVDSLAFYLFCQDALSTEDQNTTELFIYKSLRLLPKPNDNTALGRKFTKEAKKIRKTIRQLKAAEEKLPFPLRKRIMEIATQGFYTKASDYRLGEWLIETILNQPLKSKICITFQSLDNVVTSWEHSSEDKGDTEETEDLILSEDDEQEDDPNEENCSLQKSEEEIKASYLKEMQQSSHIYHVVNFAQERDPIDSLKKALRYFLFPSNPTYTPYDGYELILQEFPQLAREIDIQVRRDITEIDERQQRRARRQEELKKIKEERARQKPHIAKSFLPKSIVNGSTRRKENGKANKSNPISLGQKEQIGKKNGLRIPPPLPPLNGKQRKELIEQVSPENIEVILQDEALPDLDELLFYKKIWSLEGQRRYLSWRDLKCNLLAYGWEACDVGASFCLLYPPIWFAQTSVKGEEATPLQRIPIMLHYPKDETIKPVGNETIDFLRIIFNRDLGLSQCIVEKLITIRKT